MYANIIIDITHEKVDKVFGYHIPSELEGMLSIGSEVVVPFGNGNREKHGYVVGFSETVDYDPSKVKDILGVAKDSVAIESKLVALAAWIREEYGGTMIQALKTVIPIKRKEKQKEKKFVRLAIPVEEAKERCAFYQARKNQRARARLLEAMIQEPVQEQSLLIQKLHISAPTIKGLVEAGILKVDSVGVYRNPIKSERKEREEVVFSVEQQAAIDGFLKDYESGKRGTYLIHGVTGSGKTEVYMEMIAHVLAQGKQAIVLIPEIALTYQTVMRFHSKFGDRISILNSKMSPGERYDQMERVANGEVDVMIGPRSALFTPFRNLGLIVIDEEHESSYKSEQVPRYHARETAIKRAELEGASVVLGSATPSLEAYYGCENGDITLFELASRIGDRAMAEVYVEDMREEFRAGNRSILSRKLQNLIKDRLEKKEQIMLFLNRRGYAGFVSCRSCGYVVKCPHCDVSLSSHRGKKLVCHYCGHTEPSIDHCPSCGSPYVGGFKAGTQQIEDLVKRTFPEANVLRMDLDTTRSKEGHEKILEAFASGEADILIGTQMIVKGHDFPNVTLVGVLAADMSLYSDDYRAGERTFQLLTQAVGRAGRGKKPGEAVIQTYSPDHYGIVLSAEQDYEAFYKKEMSYRELMGYPPAEQLLAVLVTGENEELLDMAAGYLKAFAERIGKNQTLKVIGPSSPAVGKVNDMYRRVIYIKASRKRYLTVTKDRMEQYIEMNKGFDKVKIQFDLNPMNIF